MLLYCSILFLLSLWQAIIHAASAPIWSHYKPKPINLPSHRLIPLDGTSLNRRNPRPMLGQELQTAIIANIIVASLAYAAGVLTSGKIIPFLKNVYALLTNKEVQIAIERRDIFNSVEGKFDVSRFSSGIYQEIRDQYDGEVNNPNVNGRILTVSVEGIPNRVSIKLDEERPVRNIDGEVTGYRLAISPEGDLRFGYRSSGALEEFEKFADEVVTIVQAEIFPGSPPDESHVDVTIKKGVPALSGEVEDDELGISAYLDGSVLRMTMREPNNLARGIKRFLSPT